MNEQFLFLDYVPILTEEFRAVCNLNFSRFDLEKRGFIFHKLEEDGLGINYFSYVLIEKTIICFIKRLYGDINVDAPIIKTTEEIILLLKYIFDNYIEEKVTWRSPINNYNEIKKWIRE